MFYVSGIFTLRIEARKQHFQAHVFKQLLLLAQIMLMHSMSAKLQSFFRI